MAALKSEWKGPHSNTGETNTTFTSKATVFKKFDNLPADPSIVIVGGGVAGLAAATRLLHKGFLRIKILEAENRLGGRVKTVAFGQRYVDLGAHWVHGEEGNSVYEIGNDLELVAPSGDFEKVEFISDNGDMIPSDVGMDIYLKLGELLDNKEELKREKGNFYDFLVSRTSKIAKEQIQNQVLLNAFIGWLVKFESSIEGCDNLKEVSTSGLAFYRRCSGDSLITWKDGGYSSLVDILLRMHPQCDSPCVDLEDKVFLNCEVKEIDWSGLEALVKCTNGTMHRADHVIVTVSLGVLKEKHSSLFNPPLPDSKLKAIRGLGIGTINKIYLHFEQQWWSEDSSGFSLLRTKTYPLSEEEMSWEKDILGFYTESSAPCVLCGWIVGNAARDMEIYSDEQVKEGCYRVLKLFLGHQYDIPPPVDVIRSKWFSNPHFRGSYSFRSLNSDILSTSSEDLAKSVSNFYEKELLLFAGEATHSQFYSTVHGALETGWREADYIANKYTKSIKSSL